MAWMEDNSVSDPLAYQKMLFRCTWYCSLTKLNAVGVCASNVEERKHCNPRMLFGSRLATTWQQVSRLVHSLWLSSHGWVMMVVSIQLAPWSLAEISWLSDGCQDTACLLPHCVMVAHRIIGLHRMRMRKTYIVRLYRMPFSVANKIIC